MARNLIPPTIGLFSQLFAQLRHDGPVRTINRNR